MKLTGENLLKTAVKAAAESGKIQIEKLSLPKKIYFKGITDLVTDVDKLCEKTIISILKHEYPNHDILSEETEFKSTKSPFLWIVDPLDGTTNYAHGYPCFCVSIALLIKGRLSLGVVYNPVMDECYTAIEKRGAYRNGQPIHVSKTKTVSRALLCTGFPYDVGTSERNNLNEFVKITKHAQGVRRDGSAALDLCRVAEGAFDGFWEIKLKPWDVAAGALIAMEAGGTVSALDGGAFDPFADTILCSNGLLHDEMQTLLSQE